MRNIFKLNACKIMLLPLIVLSCPSCSLAQDGPTTIPDIGRLGKPVRLHTGMQFTEGPAADVKGNVYFTDVPAERIYKIDLEGALSVFTEKSRHANGLMFNRAGELIACEAEGRIAAWNVEQRRRRVVLERFEGTRFNGCNDLVIDRNGGIYFTDPFVALPQGKVAVYYLNAQGRVTRLIDDLPDPNGVMLSPDEKTLYVCPTGQEAMMAYPVDAPGKLGDGRVFCRLKQPNGKESSVADGLTVDAKGNLYITSALGLQIFNPDGNLLGVIKLPEQPANVTFGGRDHKTLYVTARTSVYTISIDATE